GPARSTSTPWWRGWGAGGGAGHERAARPHPREPPHSDAPPPAPPPPPPPPGGGGGPPPPPPRPARPGHRIQVRASIGVTELEPGDNRTPEAVLHDADVAMYRAKPPGHRDSAVADSSHVS
uniref:diguanylate cyclase domain-containing protein n=1 Tax=Nocardia farcinica TaxID=37329 RepID=UPI002455D384